MSIHGTGWKSCVCTVSIVTLLPIKAKMQQSVLCNVASREMHRRVQPK